MRLSDSEKIDRLVQIAEDLILVLRDTLWEVSAHRAVDNELQLIRDAEEIIGDESWKEQ